MPIFRLTSDQTDLLRARTELDTRLAREIEDHEERSRERLERMASKAAKRADRLKRERQNARNLLEASLARGIGSLIPRDAAIYVGDDGVGVVQWPDPPAPPAVPAQPAAPASSPARLVRTTKPDPAATEADPGEPRGEIVPMPQNGETAAAAK